MPRLVRHHAFLYKAGYTRPGPTRTLPRAVTKPLSGWLHQTWPRRSLPRVGDTIPWRVRLVPRPVTLVSWCTSRLPLLHAPAMGFVPISWAPHPALTALLGSLSRGPEPRRRVSRVCTWDSLSTIALIRAGMKSL